MARSHVGVASVHVPTTGTLREGRGRGRGKGAKRCMLSLYVKCWTNFSVLFLHHVSWIVFVFWCEINQIEYISFKSANFLKKTVGKS